MVWHSFADEQDLFPCYLYKPYLKDSEDNFIPYDPNKDPEIREDAFSHLPRTVMVRVYRVRMS